MIGRLNHVAIAVPDLAAAAAGYRDVFGATVSAPMDVPDHGVTVVFVEFPNTKIELLHPLGDHSPIRKFLENHPAGGVHHLCFETSDISTVCDKMREEGRRLLGTPSTGAHGTPVVFVHPKDFNGTLIEIEETA